jgi:threonyl-tRNA synthetase
MNAETNDHKLETMRHSAAHVMAEAVLAVFPGAKLGIGPAIDNGFYYDFELPRSLTPEDLPVITEKMKELIKKDSPFIVPR